MINQSAPCRLWRESICMFIRIPAVLDGPWLCLSSAAVCS